MRTTHVKTEKENDIVFFCVSLDVDECDTKNVNKHARITYVPTSVIVIPDTVRTAWIQANVKVESL